MSVKPIPDGYHSLTPYLCVQGGNAAIEYYKKAFGATEMFRMDGPGGTIAHAELRIGDSVIMLSDENIEWGALSPKTVGGTPTGLMLYVENVDEVFARALEAGGEVVKPLTDQFYGDRSGTLTDPFGHKWTVGTHIEDVSPEEMERRMAEMHAPAA